MSDNKVFIKTKKRDVYSFFLAIFIYSLSAVYLISLVDIEPITGCGKLCFKDVYLSIMEHNHVSITMLPILALHIILEIVKFPGTLASYRTERLFLSSQNIQYNPPRYLFNWAKAWSLNLSDIAYCTINTGFSADKLQITFNNKTKPIFILDYKRWIDPKQKRKSSWKFSTKYSEQELLVHPVIDFLVQQLGRSKVRIEIVEEEKPNFFSQKMFIKHDNSYRLDSNQATKTLTISIFGLFIYAIFDAIFVQFSYSYMSEPPLELFWFIGIVAAIAAITVQLIKKIRVHVSLILGVLIGLTSGLAGYPGTIRYITLLTDAPVETHGFVLQMIDKESKTTLFSPVDYELPPLEFRHFNDYWSQFSKGSIHEFQIIKGENGIWLIDIEKIRENALKFRHSNENTDSGDSA